MDFQNGQTLSTGFALVAVAATALVVLLTGGGFEELAYALGGGIGVAIVVVGSYGLSSRRGLPRSHSVAIASIALGAVVTLAIAFRLLTQFGA